MKVWQELSIEINQEVDEAVFAILTGMGAQGVAVEDPGLVEFAREAGLGDYFPDAVRDGRVRVTCYFPQPKTTAELEGLKERIAELSAYGLEPGPVLVSTKEVKEEDWAHAWKQYYHSLRIGRVVIHPSWENPTITPSQGDVEVVLDPGMAFGTGTHPTTAMCLDLLQGLDLAGKLVWDVGTGSGILAIVCAKLGAVVRAVDIDAVAVETAAENGRRNGVVFSVQQGSIDSLQGRPDVIVANIIADVILDILPQVAAALVETGLFIAGGIIEERAPEVEAAAQGCGLQLQYKRQAKEWVSYCFKKG